MFSYLLKGIWANWIDNNYKQNIINFIYYNLKLGYVNNPILIS